MLQSQSEIEQTETDLKNLNFTIFSGIRMIALKNETAASIAFNLPLDTVQMIKNMTTDELAAAADNAKLHFHPDNKDMIKAITQATKTNDTQKLESLQKLTL